LLQKLKAMKKILVLFAVLMIGVTMSAQTVIRSDEVRTVTIDSMLVSGELVNKDYYGKDFFENVQLQVSADTTTGTGTGDVVVDFILYGSLNNSDWNAIDTLAISGTDDNVGYLGKTAIWYDYLRLAIDVNGTGDSVTVGYQLLFDVNQ
jgi:hypothetical protein